MLHGTQRGLLEAVQRCVGDALRLAQSRLLHGDVLIDVPAQETSKRREFPSLALVDRQGFGRPVGRVWHAIEDDLESEHPSSAGILARRHRTRRSRGSCSSPCGLTCAVLIGPGVHTDGRSTPGASHRSQVRRGDERAFGVATNPSKISGRHGRPHCRRPDAGTHRWSAPRAPQAVGEELDPAWALLH